MKIHTRILLILVATALVVLVAMIILALFFVLPGFTQLEEKESLINLKRVTGQIESEKENIGELTQDLAVWDDTYRYMADWNPAYVQSVLDRTSTFESIQVQGVLYYDTAGNYFDGRWYTQGNNSPEEVSANLREYFARHATLLNSSAAGTTSTGFILLPGGSYLVACTRLCPAVEMDPPEGMVLVSVIDTVRGIPDDMKPNIFNRFMQDSDKRSSYGLGLHIVKMLISSYGGRIWVDDRVSGHPEQGAAIRFTLKKG